MDSRQDRFEQDRATPPLRRPAPSTLHYTETPAPSRELPPSRSRTPDSRQRVRAQELTYSELDQTITPRRRREQPSPRVRDVDPNNRDDVVMSISSSAIAPAPTLPRTAPARSRRTTPYVLPPVRSLVEQALPSLVMVLTALAIAALGPVSVFGIPLWAMAAAVPALAFYALANEVAHPVWSHSSVVNIVTLLAVFPALVVRQSVSRVPYISWSSGTLAAPVVMTVVLIAALAGVGLLSAYLCREDPEYAGVVFLPAAMLVPFFAGSTSITNLRTAMLMVAGIFAVTAILTVVAFVVPPSFSGLIAPVAIMIQFLVLAAIRGAAIFPVGSGFAPRFLFFVTVAATVALTILVPMASYWMRQVMLLVRTSNRTASITA
ncbi:MAG: hypothetical protein WBA46_16175 [Thermomicrobiales bacterium]